MQKSIPISLAIIALSLSVIAAAIVYDRVKIADAERATEARLARLAELDAQRATEAAQAESKCSSRQSPA